MEGSFQRERRFQFEVRFKVVVVGAESVALRATSPSPLCDKMRVRGPCRGPYGPPPSAPSAQAKSDGAESAALRAASPQPRLPRESLCLHSRGMLVPRGGQLISLLSSPCAALIIPPSPPLPPHAQGNLSPFPCAGRNRGPSAL